MEILVLGGYAHRSPRPRGLLTAPLPRSVRTFRPSWAPVALVAGAVVVKTFEAREVLAARGTEIH